MKEKDKQKKRGERERVGGKKRINKETDNIKQEGKIQGQNKAKHGR